MDCLFSWFLTNPNRNLDSSPCSFTYIWHWQKLVILKQRSQFKNICELSPFFSLPQGRLNGLDTLQALCTYCSFYSFLSSKKHLNSELNGEIISDENIMWMLTETPCWTLVKDVHAQHTVLGNRQLKFPVKVCKQNNATIPFITLIKCNQPATVTGERREIYLVCWNKIFVWHNRH